MKDELNGRVVGYSDLYVRDPSQLRKGETGADLLSSRTRWARIRSAHPDFGLLDGTCHFTGEDVTFARAQIHTVMPIGFRREIGPQEGETVILDDEEDAIVPDGTYVVSKVNDDGSFHVGGNTAVWPRRVAMRLHYYT